MTTPTEDKPQHQTSANHVDVGNLSKATENVDNREFDSLIDEATKTKDQERQEHIEEKSNQPGVGLAFTQEQAAEIALTGLNGALGIAKGVTKTNIVISQQFQMLFAAMTTPLILKYGASIKKLFDAPSQADLDGYMPEVLAASAVAVVAIPGYMQYKEQKALLGQQKTKPKQQPEPQPEQQVDNSGLH